MSTYILYYIYAVFLRLVCRERRGIEGAEVLSFLLQPRDPSIHHAYHSLHTYIALYNRIFAYIDRNIPVSTPSPPPSL
jgi:E3 ubiquitin-protein ligase DOA10